MGWIAIGLLAFALAGCGGGHTQDEVDALVSDAVEKAVSEQRDLISEAEAQGQADAATKQASLAAAVEECERRPHSIGQARPGDWGEPMTRHRMEARPHRGREAARME